jgi:hypothetical protein
MNRACWITILAATSLWAEPAPQCQFPAGDAAWTVDVVRRLSGEKEEPLHPVRIEVTRQGGLTRYRIYWSSKQITEDWAAGNCVFVQSSGGAGYSVLTTMSQIAYDRFDQGEFDWIKPACFVGEENFRGKKTLHFKGKRTRPGDSSATEAEAWLDAKTQIPLALDDGFQVCLYTFLSPPSAPLALPPACQHLKESHEKATAAPKRLGN